MSSSCWLSNLPLELLLRINSFLPFKDRLHFARTSSQLRDLFAPDLFSTIRFTNRKQDVDDFCSVVAKFGRHSQSLYFQCHLYRNPANGSGDEKNEDQDKRDHPHQDDSCKEEICTLPEEAAQLLSGQKLGHVRNITVEFLPKDNFEGENWGDQNNLGSHYIHAQPEDEDEVKSSEATSPWRRVISEVWGALSANCMIVNLHVLKLPPREVSSWHVPQWTIFLGQIRTLSINIWGCDGSYFACSNTTYGYKDFLARLDEYFFDHTWELVHLEIAADAFNIYGCEGAAHAPIALHARHFSALQQLKLSSCAIDPNLVGFLKSHAKELKLLSLTDCTSCVEDSYAEDGISWEDFFKAIRSSEPVLESFSVMNSGIPLTSHEVFTRLEHQSQQCGQCGQEIYQPPDDEPDTIKSIRKLVNQDKRMMFSYTYRGDEYGTVIGLNETNVRRFEMGADQAAYDDLKSWVEHNVARAAFGGSIMSGPGETKVER